jgi:hypothetical protein
MTLPKVAQAVLKGAETQIRELILESATLGKYQEVAALASAADLLARLLQSMDEDGDVDAVTVTHENYPPQLGQTLHRQRRSLRFYPRFEREDDKLIKVAWSKRHRAEYEHRAPRGVADTLIEAIRKRKGEGTKFEATDVLPLKNAAGREIPSYQTYLALAWLRQEGIVIKHGRDQYSLKPGTATSERITEIWQALPER